MSKKNGNANAPDSFLPPDYEPPAGQSNYLRPSKLKIGNNKLRILSKPIVGWLGWIVKEGKPYPERIPNTKDPVKHFTAFEMADEEQGIQHFWAMVVWNYDLQQVQIMEITQPGLQKKLTALIVNPDWGSPINYNITIVKSGQGLQTRYDINPSPPSELEAEVKEMISRKPVNLEALFDGKDPFESKKEKAPF